MTRVSGNQSLFNSNKYFMSIYLSSSQAKMHSHLVIARWPWPPCHGLFVIVFDMIKRTWLEDRDEHFTSLWTFSDHSILCRVYMEERKKCTASKHRDTHMHEQSLYGFRGGQCFELLVSRNQSFLEVRWDKSLLNTNINATQHKHLKIHIGTQNKSVTL